MKKQKWTKCVEHSYEFCRERQTCHEHRTAPRTVQYGRNEYTVRPEKVALHLGKKDHELFCVN